MLAVEKVGVAALNVVYAPFLTPMWVWMDLARAESRLRGIEVAGTYGSCHTHPDTILGYVFE